jgi:hypothetical protein
MSVSGSPKPAVYKVIGSNAGALETLHPNSLRGGKPPHPALFVKETDGIRE